MTSDKRISVFEKVCRAIKAVGDRKGTSTQAIRRWIFNNYPESAVPTFSFHFKKAIAKGVAMDWFINGHSAVRYRLTPLARNEMVKAARAAERKANGISKKKKTSKKKAPKRKVSKKKTSKKKAPKRKASKAKTASRKKKRKTTKKSAK